MLGLFDYVMIFYVIEERKEKRKKKGKFLIVVLY